MVSSFAVSMVFFVLGKYGTHFTTSASLLITVAVTTVCWVLVARFGPETDRATLVSFYTKVRPFGPGWAPVRAMANLPERGVVDDRDNIPLALVGWVAGCSMIWSALFTVGNFLYGRTDTALFLLATFVVSGAILIRVVQRLWRGSNEPAEV